MQKENAITYHYVIIKDLKIFYRTAGNPKNPVIVLLHGFPSASHQFQELIHELADNYHLIAPDYPGFGNSDIPDRKSFTYTFDRITDIIESFIENLGLNQYDMYIFDYGAPIGFRLALQNPKKITAIISQNGNIYREGLGEKWSAHEKYWINPTLEQRNLFRSAYAPETIKGQYLNGTEKGKVSPDAYTLDIYYMSRPEVDEPQSDLVFDYQNNVKMYPQF